jgi:hypothetical protein
LIVAPKIYSIVHTMTTIYLIVCEIRLYSILGTCVNRYDDYNSFFENGDFTVFVKKIISLNFYCALRLLSADTHRT